MVLSGFGIPLLVAWLTMGSEIYRPIDPSEIRVPFLFDWNMNFLMLVTVPTIVVMILAETNLIGNSICHIQSDGLLMWKDNQENEFCYKWKARYAIWNRIAVLIGSIFGLIGVWLNTESQHLPHFGWAFRPESTASTWILIIQTFVFIWILAFGLVRYLTHIFFFLSLNSNATINIHFYHPDGCGGLKSISFIGLRIIYVGAILIVNLFILYYILCKIFPSFNKNVGGLSVVTISFYLLMLCWIVILPILFIGPIIPFHKTMVSQKCAILDSIANTQRDLIPNPKDKSENGQIGFGLLKRIKDLDETISIVRRFPEWPIDTPIKIKFSLAITSPVIAKLITTLASELF